MPKGVYVRTKEMRKNIGRYKRTSEIRIKCSESKKQMYILHPEKKPIGKKNGMYGKSPNILSRLEGSIIRSTIPQCQHPIRKKGWHQKKSTIEKIRQKHLGDSNAMRGRVGKLSPRWKILHTAETKAKISKANKGRKYPDHIIKKRLLACSIKPNKFELAVQKWLDEKYPNEWKYCGDGSVILNGHCPDFINVNGKKQVILANSVYWHTRRHPNKTRKQIEKIEMKPYDEIGFDIWFIWNDDFKKGVLT